MAGCRRVVCAALRSRGIAAEESDVGPLVARSQQAPARPAVNAWMLANNQTSFTYPPTPYFTDVPSTDQFFSFIQKVAQLGIWTGCGNNQFCESSAVTRDQMAPMVMRSMLGTP